MITAEMSRSTNEIPGLSHDEWMRIGATQNDGLLDLLRDLSSEEWDAPTDCTLWSVKDITAHILGEAEGFTSWAEIRRQAVGGLRRRRALGSFLNGMNETQVEDRRHLSPGELIARLEQRLPRFMEVRKRLGRVGRFVPTYDPFLGATNLRYLMETIFARDAFMHRVDVARATDREVSLGTAEGSLVADVVRDWSRRHKVSARVELEGPIGGTFVAGSGSARIAGDAIEFCRVVSGRAEPDALRLSGDVDSARNWLKKGCPF
jgi:uncharacterized protein (TIGR03083 family)